MSASRPLGCAVGYLASTESAVRHLFKGINTYREMIRKGMVKGPAGSLADMDPEVRNAAIEEWMHTQAEAIAKGFEWQRRYHAERFARATLCGAVLQIAQKALEVHSTNEHVPSEWKPRFQGPLARYCVGPPVRCIPRGLVVYAARNQSVHFNERTLNASSRVVFDRLALEHGQVGFQGVKSPDFDIDNHAGHSLASSVLELLGWRDYESYETDMRRMLGVAG